MSGTYSRSRFFQLPKYDSILSSRFGGIPALMLEERDPTPIQQTRYSYSPFNPNVVLPPIKYRKFGSNVSNELNLPFTLRKPLSCTNSMSHHNILDHLLATLPDNEILPDIPIVISQEQENSIFLETNYQLSNYDPIHLRDLYMTLTNIDRDLTGCITYRDLLMTFQRKQVPITEQLLRLIAAQFVSRKDYTKVNYERVLSFIGAALKINKNKSEDDHFALTNNQSQRVQKYQSEFEGCARTIYYHDSQCSNNEDSQSVYTEKDDPTILRLLENSVRHQFTPINLENLRLAFQRADSLHRGSLSEYQIKELCFHHDVKIEDSVIERVIRRCKQRGGGQYDWQQFVRYLERVQPVQTSLSMTSSRMPNQLIKYVPHPSSSWPQAESPRVWGSPYHRHNSPTMPRFRENYETDIHLPPPLAATSNSSIQSLQINSEVNDPLQLKLKQLQEEMYELNEPHNKYDDVSTETQPIDNLTENQEILNYEEKNSGHSTRANYKPWFDRFIEMADRIYIEDRTSSGVLSQSKIVELVEKYNKQLDLNLKKEDMRDAIVASQKNSGLIDINHFLRILAVKS